MTSRSEWLFTIWLFLIQICIFFDEITDKLHRNRTESEIATLRLEVKRYV